MEQELRMLLKRPGNEVCADCGARYPRFASITLAIFLCNRCYGIHRSVGAHITRTKTVGLDRWSGDEVHKMSSIGNVVANAYWEVNVPSQYARPTADSPDFIAEKWIRDKYERKLFCPPYGDPPSVTSQTSEATIPDATSRRRSSQVKLLPRGALQCGPNCIVARVPDDTCNSITSSDMAPTDNMMSQSTLHDISNLGQTLYPSNSVTGVAVNTAGGDSADLDDDEFGDFVQA